MVQRIFSLLKVLAQESSYQKAVTRSEEVLMIYSVQLIVLSVLLVIPMGSQADQDSGIPLSEMVRYDSLPLWQQSSPFPRWQDTYAIVFEQEMLA